MTTNHDLMFLGVAAVCVATNFAGAFFTIRRVFPDSDNIIAAIGAGFGLIGLGIYTAERTARPHYFFYIFITLIISSRHILTAFDRADSPSSILKIFLSLAETEQIGLAVFGVIIIIAFSDFARSIFSIFTPTRDANRRKL